MMDIQLSQDLFDLGIEIPGIQFVDPDYGIGQLVDIFRIARSLIGLNGIDDRMIVIENIVENGFFFDENRFLFEEGYRYILVYPHGPAFRRVFTGKDPEQCGLTAAITGDKGDLVAFFYMKCDVLKKWLYAV